MNSVKAAMVIMVASGMIADFDLSERDNDLYITVWSVDEHPAAHLRKHVAAIVPGGVDEARISVMNGAVA